MRLQMWTKIKQAMLVPSGIEVLVWCANGSLGNTTIGLSKNQILWSCPPSYFIKVMLMPGLRVVETR